MVLKNLFTGQQWRNFPGGSDGKVSVYNVGHPGLIPGLGTSAGEGNGNPLHDYCLENRMDRGAWLGLQSMEFSRPEYWSGQPFPSPGDLPNPGIKPGCPALQVDSLSAKPQGSPAKTLAK